MKKIISILSVLILGIAAVSCNFLDVVPEGKATLDDLFKTKTQANSFVASLYSTTYLPDRMNSQASVEFAGGGDIMSGFYGATRYFKWKSIIYDDQESASNTFYAFWSQTAASYPSGTQTCRIYEGIRNAYRVLDNIDHVGDASREQKDMWKGEALFAIGYAHQTLLEYYGPIQIVRETISLSDNSTNPRDPYLDCVQFISDTYDKAAELLPAKQDPQYYGRATRTLVKVLKARVWLQAASPLVNGNTEWYSGFNNPDGTPLMPQSYDKELWKKAMEAAQDAIKTGETDGFGLYTSSSQGKDDFEKGYNNYRDAFVGGVSSSGFFNDKEILLGIVSSEYNMKNMAARMNNLKEPATLNYNRDGFRGYFVPTMDAVNCYLSKNGLPMDVDPETKDIDLYAVNAKAQTANLHLNREPRFYASIGYDRGEYDINGETIILKCHHGEAQQNDCDKANEYQSCTGYYIKKWINKSDTYNPTTNSFGFNKYYYPYVRFTEAYLDFAEAEAEYTGSLSATGLACLNKVRNRCGLPDFETSWAKAGGTPAGATLVKAIRQERMAEFCLEGRWWFDLRRWKVAHDYLTPTPKCWNLEGKTTEEFYQIRDVDEGTQKRTFTAPKNYWLSVPQDQININPNLVQNPGYGK